MALPFPISGDMLAIVNFLVVWLVSSGVLWLSARIFVPDKASFPIAAVAAIVGAAVFSLFSGRLLYTLIALILWIFILKSLFNVGWGRSFLIALGAWILGTIVGWILGIPMIF